MSLVYALDTLLFFDYDVNCYFHNPKFAETTLM